MDLLGYVTDAILTVKRGTYIAIKKYPFIFEINMASKKYMTMDYDISNCVICMYILYSIGNVYKAILLDICTIVHIILSSVLEKKIIK